MTRWKIIALLIGLCAARGFGDEPATQPDADDPPVSAAVAPTYIAIGRELSMRLNLVRRTLDDLTLDASVRGQANQLVESCRKEVDGLVSQMRVGPMPSVRVVLMEPSRLRAGQQALYQLIGPDQTQALDEMLRSLRGEARTTLGRVRLMLEDLNCDGGKMRTYQSILAGADAEAESLPHAGVPDGEYDAQRKKLDGLLAKVRDELTASLTPGDLERLGPKFEQLLPPVTDASQMPAPANAP